MTNASTDHLELQIDKFTFKIPRSLLYSEPGVWVRREGNLFRVGLSDFAQQRNGDIAFANVTPVGTMLDVDDEMAGIETVKVNLSLPSPMKCTIVEINTALQEAAELINREPYGRGWLALVSPTDWDSDRGSLLDAEAYMEAARRQAEAELKW